MVDIMVDIFNFSLVYESEHFFIFDSFGYIFFFIFIILDFGKNVFCYEKGFCYDVD